MNLISMNRSNIVNSANKLSPYFLLSSAILVILLFVLGFNKIELDWPVNYKGDFLVDANGVKNVVEHNNYLINTRLGLPGYQTFYDFPLPVYQDYIWYYFLSSFTNNWIKIINVYSIITFELIGICAYYALTKVTENRLSSIILATLYAFLPYHLFKYNNHIHLATYYVVPLAVLLAYDISRVQDRLLTFRQQIIITALVSISHPYYLFLSLYFIAIGFIKSLLNDKQRIIKIYRVVSLMALMVLIFTITISPSLLYWHRYGKPDSFNNRTIKQTEVYALRISHLIFPSEYHRIQPLTNLIKNYSQFYTAERENMSNYLGIVALSGFFLLLIVPWIPRLLNNELFNSLNDLSLFLYAGIILGIPGGLATIAATFTYPFLRVYSRLSVFIAFLSLIAVGLLLNKIYYMDKKAFTIISVLLLIIGIFDQTPNGYMRQDAEEYLADAEFAKLIDRDGEKRKIFHDPMLYYPEGGNYDYLKLPLLTTKAAWSIGALKDRGAFILQNGVFSESTKDTIDKIILLGFNGLIVNNENGGARLDHTVIQEYLSIQPVKHPSKQIYYFDLSSIIPENKGGTIPLGAYLTNGCVKQKFPQNKIEYYCDKDFKIIITNFNSSIQKYKINIQFSFFNANNSVTFSGLLIDNIVEHDYDVTYDSEMEVLPGESVINVSIDTEGSARIPKEFVRPEKFDHAYVTVTL